MRRCLILLLLLLAPVAWAAPQTLLPDCVAFARAGLENPTGDSTACSYVDEDPSSDDTLWVTSGSSTPTPKTIRLSFPTPAQDPSGTQTFRVRARRSGGGSNVPTMTCSALLTGDSTASPRCTVINNVSLSDTNPGLVFEGTWNPATCGSPSIATANPSGDAVEIFCTSETQGSGGSARWAGYGAFSWVSNPGTPQRRVRVIIQ